MSGTSVSVWRRRCAATLLMLAMSAVPAIGGDLAERLLDEARDGQLDTLDFLSAALIAGGIDDACELEGWHDRYVQSRERLLQSLRTSEPLEPFESLHEALH